MKKFLTFLFVVLLVGLISCNQEEKSTSSTTTLKTNDNQRSNPTLSMSGKIMDVIQTTSYTYCKMKVAGDQYWIAISKLPVKKGETLYFNQGLKMKDFHSRELNRNFSVLYLVQDVSTASNQQRNGMQQLDQEAVKPVIVKMAVKVKPVKNGITIAELYANKMNYAGKKVKIRGKVTKFNPNILGKNWVHIQDGSTFDGNFDLTVTTQSQLSVGEVVAFDGKITLNKDLGAGYFYPVIMEDAVVVK